MPSRPIALIDDDPDDLEFTQEAIKQLDPGREVISFLGPEKFLDFVRATDKIFLFILCDINMSKMDGLQLKKLICDDERLRRKCIPFLFFSTASTSASVEEAYSYNAQGYFVKPNHLNEFKSMLEVMISYWSASERPHQGRRSKQ